MPYKRVYYHLLLVLTVSPSAQNNAQISFIQWSKVRMSPWVKHVSPRLHSASRSLHFQRLYLLGQDMCSTNQLRNLVRTSELQLWERKVMQWNSWLIYKCLWTYVQQKEYLHDAEEHGTINGDCEKLQSSRIRIEDTPILQQSAVWRNPREVGSWMCGNGDANCDTQASCKLTGHCRVCIRPMR